MAFSIFRWNRAASAALLLAACVALSACSIQQDKSQGRNSVEIKTPVGGVSINGANTAQETGLAVYPGAKPRAPRDGKDSSANVNLSSNRFGLKVAVIEMVTDDPPEKVAAFYRKELAKYGRILECPGRKGVTVGWVGKASSDSDKDNNRLTCADDTGGKTLELKVGTRENLHLVAVETKDGHTEFALVHLRMQREGDAI